MKNLLPGVRLEVIPHGVTSRRLQPDAARRLRKKHAVPDNHPVLLFLSRWHAKKNISLLLESLAGLRQEPWTLILAGGTDDANFATAINERIQALGLHDRVHCPGHVSGDDKDLLLQGADLFVLPSASENFGIAVAEALVSGLPVLVSSGVDLAGAVRDLQGGMICEATLSSLQTGLRAMLQNCSRQSEEHRAALRAAATARFSWEQNALALRVLYEDICRPGHGHPQA